MAFHSERAALEACLAEAKRTLDAYRHAGNQLMESVTEADINRMLEELSRIYRRGAHDRPKQ